MKKRHPLLHTLPLLAACLAFCPSQASLAQAVPAQTRATQGIHRVVFALTSSEQADWGLTIGNIRNLIAALAPDTVQVEVVAYGPGILLVKSDSPVAAAIAALQQKGVRFVACENAMHAHNLTLKDLLPGVQTVPAGIAEVILKQEQGWSYIKAGR